MLSEGDSMKGAGITSKESVEQGSAPPNRGNLIVVSAPSGSGKSTLVEIVLGRLDRLRYSISCTTRKARGIEKHGVDYYFVDEAEFLAMTDRGEFLECAEVHGSYYGTPSQIVEQTLQKGDDVILDLDVQGARQIRQRMPEAVFVFILPPSLEVLESRLRARNLNDPADLEHRLKNAVGEVRLFEDYKFVIINDDINRASAALEAIIIAERQRLERQRHIAQEIIATFGGESLHA